MTFLKNVRLSKLTINPADALSGLGLCTGAVWEDDFSFFNSDHWSLFDPSLATEFGANGWVKTGELSLATSPSMSMSSRSFFEGAFDCCVELTIDETAGEGVVGEESLTIKLVENVAHGSVLYLYWRPKTGAGEVAIQLVGGGSDVFHSQQFSVPGTFHIRITRDESNNLYVFLWNDSLERWEWDGDTDGWGPITNIDGNQVWFWITWRDYAAAKWVQGSIKNVKLNEGIFNDV